MLMSATGVPDKFQQVELASKAITIPSSIHASAFARDICFMRIMAFQPDVVRGIATNLDFDGGYI